MPSLPVGTADGRSGTDVITVALVDDHPMVRTGIAAVLQGEADDVAVLAGVGTIAELRASPGWGAHVVLLDLMLADGTRVEENVAALTAAGSRVVMVSALAQGPVVRRALRAGALGYVPKATEDVGELLAAVRAAAAGEPFTSAALASLILDAADPKFSGQELRCLVLYADGLAMKSVARRLGIEEDTAKSYIDRVRDKYVKAGRDVSNRVALYKRAVEDGHLGEY